MKKENFSKQIKWSKDKIILELKNISDKLGSSPSVSQISPKLYQVCCRYFGSFNNAKKCAKLDVKERIINNILKKSKKLSVDLAYILGVISGDGHVRVMRDDKRSSGVLYLRVKDIDFAFKFRDTLEKWSKCEPKFNKMKNGFYRVCLYSVDAAEFIKNFNINLILKSNNDIQCFFLKGLYDSEGCIAGSNLDKRYKASRHISFSNSNKDTIRLVSTLLSKLNIKHSTSSRIHSGFGSKKLQYEIVITGLQNIFSYYKNIGFSIQRKQKKLKKVINSYNFHTRETFNKARKLHKLMGYAKVARELNVPKAIVYGWLFKNYQDRILDIGGKNET